MCVFLLGWNSEQSLEDSVPEMVEMFLIIASLKLLYNLPVDALTAAVINRFAAVYYTPYVP